MDCCSSISRSYQHNGRCVDITTAYVYNCSRFHLIFCRARSICALRAPHAKKNYIPHPYMIAEPRTLSPTPRTFLHIDTTAATRNRAFPASTDATTSGRAGPGVPDSRSRHKQLFANKVRALCTFSCINCFGEGLLGTGIRPSRDLRAWS